MPYGFSNAKKGWRKIESADFVGVEPIKPPVPNVLTTTSGNVPLPNANTPIENTTLHNVAPDITKKLNANQPTSMDVLTEIYNRLQELPIDQARKIIRSLDIMI